MAKSHNMFWKTYGDVRDYFNEHVTAKNRDKVKLCNNTYLVREYVVEDYYIYYVVHFNTAIVIWTPMFVRLDTGGHRTVTTKSRLNWFSPVSVFADKGIWYVQFPDHREQFYDGVEVYPWIK